MTGAPTLGDWLEARRAELEARDGQRRDWAVLAKTIGISRGSFHEIRQGKAAPRPVTKRHIERAFEWAPRSVDRIERGEEPIRLEDQAAAQEELKRADIGDLAARFAELAKNHTDQELLTIMAKVMEIRSGDRPERGHEAG